LADSGHTPALVLLATAADCWALDEDADELLAALDRAGIRAEPAIWDDPERDWGQAAAVVVRSTWDYPLRRCEFLAWARQVGRVTTLLNPPDVLEWNTDKRYLGDLAAQGVPVVPTAFLSQGTQHTTAMIEAAMGHTNQVVVKPSVSAGSRDTARFDTGHTAQAVALAERITNAGRTAMVQPYLDSVDTHGETGLVYFGGEFSHGFNKAALLTTVGEIDHGIFALESIAAEQPSHEHRTLAEAVLAVTAERFGAMPTYARIDMLADSDAELVLLELELTEPSWFLATDPGAADRAAAVIAAAVS
jgi:glutathione synthase/RimK-type ligase-like ATP-grasp enzyme